jgi:hypothetical protein
MSDIRQEPTIFSSSMQTEAMPVQYFDRQGSLSGSGDACVRPEVKWRKQKMQCACEQAKGLNMMRDTWSQIVSGRLLGRRL